ncbi:uncharacterized protein [Branchiostoma lanceolatum]|uniref:uncharacterized protein isoform X3 n=1 Tax=Branchiostoma lanceolatum TaxID=7740 RepID=UPI0034547E22
MSYSKGIAKGLGAAMVGFGLISVILGIVSVIVGANSAFNCNWFACVSGSIVIVAGILGFVSGKMADSKGSMIPASLYANFFSILLNLTTVLVITPGNVPGRSFPPEGKTWAVWIPSCIFAFFEMVTAVCCCILCLESMVGYFTKREPGPVLYKDEQATMLPARQEAVQVEEEADKTK